MVGLNTKGGKLSDNLVLVIIDLLAEQLLQRSWRRLVEKHLQGIWFYGLWHVWLFLKTRIEFKPPLHFEFKLFKKY